jgi:WhiB family redox-sensing transcriptional regulator
MTTIDRQTIQPLTDDWDWQLSAACRGMDVEIFYHPAGERLSEKTARINWAKQICCRCAVINECALWALKTREPYGIWGGHVREGAGRDAGRSEPALPGHCRCSAAQPEGSDSKATLLTR